MYPPLFLDVIAGPVIAIVVGVYIILPIALIALVMFLTGKLIQKLKHKHKEEET